MRRELGDSRSLSTLGQDVVDSLVSELILGKSMSLVNAQEQGAGRLSAHGEPIGERVDGSLVLDGQSRIRLRLPRIVTVRDARL